MYETSLASLPKANVQWFVAVCCAEQTPTKPLLADQVFTLNPKQNPPVIARATGQHLDLNQRDIYIYIHTQRGGGLNVEEKTMKVVVALVLVE